MRKRDLMNALADPVSINGTEKPPDAESTMGYSVDAYDRINEQVYQMKQKIMQSKLEHEDFSKD